MEKRFLVHTTLGLCKGVVQSDFGVGFGSIFGSVLEVFDTALEVF